MRRVEELGLPDTPMVVTSRGYHMYLAGDSDSYALEGIDILGRGKSASAPPSMHKTGRLYEWFITPEEMQLAPFPAELFPRPEKPRNALRSTPTVESIEEGERNATLFRLGCDYAAKGLDEFEVEALLIAINEQRSSPALEDREIARIAGSARKTVAIDALTVADDELRNIGLPDGAYRLYRSMVSNADHQGYVIASKENMANWTGMSGPTVIKHRKTLEALDLLTVDHRGGSMKGDANRYQLTNPLTVSDGVKNVDPKSRKVRRDIRSSRTKTSAVDRIARKATDKQRRDSDIDGLLDEFGQTQRIGEAT